MIAYAISNQSFTKKDAEVRSKNKKIQCVKAFSLKIKLAFLKIGLKMVIDNQYVNWLRQEHPYSLLNGLFNIEQIDTCIHLP